MKIYNSIRLVALALLVAAGLAVNTDALAQEGTKNPSLNQEAKASSATTLVGEWREFWNPGKQTDVTYHDRYKITTASSGAVEVRIISRSQRISSERVEGATLSFTQQTDTLTVEYSLTLQPDGNWLVGTAKTPKELVPVKWERVR